MPPAPEAAAKHRLVSLPYFSQKIYCTTDRVAPRRLLVEITRKEIQPGVVVLELKGSLLMGVESKRLELAIDDILREKKNRVVLDLTNVPKVDSGGVGKIVNCLSRLRVAGGTLHLAGVTGMVTGVLRLTQVDRLMKIYPTALEASESFSDQQSSPPA
jgi:anti-sigma B factor antagonist